MVERRSKTPPVVGAEAAAAAESYEAYVLEIAGACAGGTQVVSMAWFRGPSVRSGAGVGKGKSLGWWGTSRQEHMN